MSVSLKLKSKVFWTVCKLLWRKHNSSISTLSTV